MEGEEDSAETKTSGEYCPGEYLISPLLNEFSVISRGDYLAPPQNHVIVVRRPSICPWLGHRSDSKSNQLHVDIFRFCFAR